MSSSEKNQALAVVIEKLTEIVDNINQQSRSGDTSPNTDRQSPQSEHGESSQHVLMEISPEEALGTVDDDTEQDVDESSSPTELQEVEITTAAIEEIASSEVYETDTGDIVHIVNIDPVAKTSESPSDQVGADAQDRVRRPLVSDGGHRELYKCIKCDYVSHNKHYLKQHVVLVHTADRPFKCPLCDYSGKRSHSLKEHLVVHSPYRPFTCPFCRASFRKKGHLTNHIKIHASDQGLSCSICKRVLPGQADLSEHMRQEHTGDIHFCEVCNYASASEVEIIAHKHDHGFPTVYCCSTCKYITIQESLIRKHITVNHNGQGAFKVNTSAVQSRPVVLLKCSECGFVTNDKVKLRQHMLDSHTGSRSESTSGSTTAKKGERSQTSLEPQSLAPSVAGHSKDVKPTPPGSPTDNEVISLDAQKQGYTQHKVAGVYCCMICGYTCDHQRSIKAHIWKHSGRKDLNYPIFQSRPDEPRDGTIGESKEKSLTCNTVQDCVESNIGAEIETPIRKCIDKHQEIQADKISANQLTTNAINGAQDPQEIAIKTVNSRSQVQDKFAVESTSTISQIEPQVEKLSQIACHSKYPGSERLQGVKRKAAALSSELDVSMPKLRIVNSSNDLHLQEKQDQECQDNAVEGKPTYKASEKESHSISSMQKSEECVTSSIKVEKQFDQHEISEIVGSNEQVMLMKDEPGDEYMLEVEIETTEDGKSTPDIISDIPNENEHDDENVPVDLPQPISLRALLQRQRSSNDLPALTKTPFGRNRSGSLDLETTEDSHKEMGISSSLLAVIEQFRKDASSGSQSLTVDSDVITERYVEKYQNQYRCRLCPYTSLNISSIKNHLRSHSKPKKLCSFCSFVAESNEQLQNHMVKSHPNAGHTCKECHKSFDSDIQLRNHTQSHCGTGAELVSSDDVMLATKRAKQYICENCDCSFNSIEALLKHKMKKLCWNKHNTSGGSDNGSSEEKDCFRCNFCDYVGMSVRSLKSHMKRHWNDLKANQLHEDVQLPAAHDPSQVEKYYVCERCTSVFSGIMDLLAHKQSACIGVVPKCMHCSFSSSDAELFKKHMSHHVGKLYKCEQCEFVSKSYSKMDTHLKQHIEPSDLHCTLCDFMATSVRSLKSHMKRHDNDQRFVRQPLEQYKCKMCGYICHHLPALKSHMWRHASDSSYSYEKTNAVINAALEMGFPQDTPGMTTKETSEDDVVVPSSADYSRKVVDGLVAFRCCHCFFETCAKNELNEHMKKHIDIIKKTMEVNNDLFVTRDKVDDT